MLEGENN